MNGVDALYLFMLAGIAGYVLISRVPSVLHIPLLAGSSFVHGVVLAGAMLALANATGWLEIAIGFIAVTASSANVVGGLIATDRRLALFEMRNARRQARAVTGGKRAGAGGGGIGATDANAESVSRKPGNDDAGGSAR